MKKNDVFIILPLLFILVAPHFSAQSGKKSVILYLNPEIYPPIEDISQPTFLAFSQALEEITPSGKLLSAGSSENYDQFDEKTVTDYAVNNNADYVLIPKIKYFKVGIGRYILSNQVEVSIKLLDKKGKLLCESVYNTYKKNMRILGSAENSIKKGTKGALKNIFAEIRKNKKEVLN